MRTRIDEEVALVQVRFGPTSVGPEGLWVRVEIAELASGWNRSSTPILVEIPQGYPTVPPDNFFTAADLRLVDGRVPSNTMGTKKIGNDEWLGFSHHAEGGTWNAHTEVPTSHTLLDYFEGVLDRLGDCS